MPNQISASGLQIASVAEITSNLTASMKAIYGADINLASNTPDGQLLGIYAQASEDILELLLDAYNSFDVEQAYGVILDQRVAINGIARQQGTFTTTPILVTVSQAITLTGQDALVSNPTAQVFTIADGAGNQYQLQTTHVFSAGGSATLTFVAVTIGAIQPAANAITNTVTVLTGVTSVNNPSLSGVVVGNNEETDVQLKIRRSQSFYLAAIGPSDALRAQLLAVPGIADAYVVENNTGAAVNGVAAYSIYTIVNIGTATPAQVAQAIYAKKAPGCGQTGSQTYSVARPQGNAFIAQWDYAISQPLYIKAQLLPRIPGQIFNLTADTAALVAALVYKLGQSPNIGDIVLAMQAIEPNAVLINVQVSKDNSTFEDIVSPTLYLNYFVASTANTTLSQ